MNRSQLIELEKSLIAEVVKRRSLGGYNSDAEAILMMAEGMLKIVGHLLDEAYKESEPKKKAAK